MLIENSGGEHGEIGAWRHCNRRRNRQPVSLEETLRRNPHMPESAALSSRSYTAWRVISEIISHGSASANQLSGEGNQRSGESVAEKPAPRSRNRYRRIEKPGRKQHLAKAE